MLTLKRRDHRQLEVKSRNKNQKKKMEEEKGGNWNKAAL